MWTRFAQGTVLLASLLLPVTAHSDEYARIARLSFVEGHVSFQHPKEVDWSDASINLALQPEDRIYTATDGRAEIEFDDGSALRLAEQTDVELVTMGENLVQIRVLLGLCTLTRRGDLPFDVSTPAAEFRTLRKGIYRFDVTETGATDGIVRKGEMQASGGKFDRGLGDGELIHVEAGGQETPIVSRYGRRDGWDEWTDRRTADQEAFASTKYLPDYVHAGVSDLDQYGRWVEIETYGYGWVPYYVDIGWSPYWDGRWCYRPGWGWTWVSYEPWGWLPYHYGNWYFSAGFGWCWIPGPSAAFHFWSPGLVRFYDGPGWISWIPLGPGDYYNVHNYCYNRRYGHLLNDMRLAQRRGPDDLVNHHAPGAFRAEPREQFVNGGRARGMPLDSVAQVSQPWRSSRPVTDRLSVEPTPRSYHPMVSSRPGADAARSAFSPAVVRPAARAGNSGSAGSEAPATAAPADAAARTSGRTWVRRTPGDTAPVDARNAGPESPADRPVRIWNRIEGPAAGAETSNAERTGSASVGSRANPRSSGRTADGTTEGQVERGRSLGTPSDAYTAPSPLVIERGANGETSIRTYGGNRTEAAPREPVRTESASPDYPPQQRNDSRGQSGFEVPDRGRAVQPSITIPERAPAYSPGTPRPGGDGRDAVPGRGQPPGGGNTAGTPRPSWGGGGSQAVVRPAATSTSQSPSWGRSVPQQPAMGQTGPPRSAPPAGTSGRSRGKEP